MADCQQSGSWFSLKYGLALTKAETQSEVTDTGDTGDNIGGAVQYSIDINIIYRVYIVYKRNTHVQKRIYTVSSGQVHFACPTIHVQVKYFISSHNERMGKFLLLIQFLNIIILKRINLLPSIIVFEDSQPCICCSIPSVVSTSHYYDPKIQTVQNIVHYYKELSVTHILAISAIQLSSCDKIYGIIRYTPMSNLCRWEVGDQCTESGAVTVVLKLTNVKLANGRINKTHAVLTAAPGLGFQLKAKWINISLSCNIKHQQFQCISSFFLICKECNDNRVLQGYCQVISKHLLLLMDAHILQPIKWLEQRCQYKCIIFCPILNSHTDTEY